MRTHHVKCVENAKDVPWANVLRTRRLSRVVHKFEKLEALLICFASRWASTIPLKTLLHINTAIYEALFFSLITVSEQMQLTPDLWGSYMMVDKLKYLICNPHVQNLRLIRPPIPSSGSLVSTVLITHPSRERATKVTITCIHKMWGTLILLCNFAMLSTRGKTYCNTIRSKNNVWEH